MNLSNAGNVVIPSIRALLDLGFEVSQIKATGEFTATKNGNRFSAEDPVALLGLIKLYECRGENWQLSDDDLSELGKRYNLL